jgi:hypothetical protein
LFRQLEDSHESDVLLIEGVERLIYVSSDKIETFANAMMKINLLTAMA